MIVRQFAKDLYRSDAPRTISDLKSLQIDYGVRTIVNLEALWPAQQRQVAWQCAICGIRQIFIPFVALLPPAFGRKGWRDVERVLGLLDDPSLRPIDLHCLQGVDRTGFIVACWRILYEGKSRRWAVDEMRRLGSHWRFRFWEAWLPDTRKALPVL